MSSTIIRTLNIALVLAFIMLGVSCVYGYDRWTAMEDSRRGQ